MNQRHFQAFVCASAVLFTLGCTNGSSTGPHDVQTTTAVVEHPGEGVDSAGVPTSYPGQLIATEDIEGAFMARQKLSGTFGEQKFAFEAVLQFHDGALTVLGLTPFGTKAFVLEQRGTEVEFQPLIDREIPFPPEYILQDIHRVWLWHARLPWGDKPAPGQENPSADVAGERVSEQWIDGKLVRRTFERLDGEPAGSVRVDYVGGHRHHFPPKRTVLVNGWFGYQLEIETVEWRKL